MSPQEELDWDRKAVEVLIGTVPEWRQLYLTTVEFKTMADRFVPMLRMMIEGMAAGAREESGRRLVAMMAVQNTWSDGRAALTEGTDNA